MTHLMPLSAFLVAVLIICASTSCSKQGERIHTLLSTADSLTTHNPQAAMAMLSAIDSTTKNTLNHKNSALYNLLITEAKYKCYHPIAKDSTTIIKTAEYFRKHKHDNLYARAMILLGAAALENGHPIQALITYKKAETILKKIDDTELLGLINTRLGELYRLSFVNNTESAQKYQNALTYFKMCGREDRVMYSHLSLARVLTTDSIESSLSHIMQAITIAKARKDKVALLSAYEILTHTCRLKNDLKGVIYYSNESTVECHDIAAADVVLPIWNNIYTEQAYAYATLGIPDLAIKSASRIIWQNTAPDTMARHWVSAAIAKSTKKWQQAFEHTQSYRTIADSLENIASSTQIRYAELLLEKKEFEANSRQAIHNRNSIIIILSLGLISIFSIIAALHQRYRKLSEKHNNLLASVNICEQPEIQNIEKILSHTMPNKSDTDNLKMDIHEIIVDLTGMISEINNTYFRYKNNISSHRFLSNFDNIIKRYFPEKQTYEKIRNICKILYPGVMENIEAEHSELTQNDLLLIALMGCKFPTGAICAIKGMTVGSLNSQKTRTAKKIGQNIKLSEFVAAKFS